ncbi:MAG: hypothetical protein ACREUY_03180 [Burkholderiales bacterium]
MQNLETRLTVAASLRRVSEISAEIERAREAVAVALADYEMPAPIEDDIVAGFRQVLAGLDRAAAHLEDVADGRPRPARIFP